MSLKKFAFAFCPLMLASFAYAAAPDPVQWTLELDRASAPPGGKILARLAATIGSGWHLYAPTTPPGGPIPTTLSLAANPAVASVRILEPKPDRKFDPNFNLDTETFSTNVVFWLEIAVAKDAPAGPTQLTAQVRYQCCSETLCLPPKRKTATAAFTVDPAAPASAGAIPPGYTDIAAAVGAPPKPAKPATNADSQDLGRFLLVAFGLGLAAIFTPCVFPMIPITVSYFLNKKTEGRRDGAAQAAVFCLGIIFLFTGLGLLTKAVAGPFGIVQLGSNPWVNGFISTVFLAFGLSLLGAFEITLPSGLLTRLDRASQRGGYLGTLLMGLTFALTSFACVGPFLGTLLAASVQGSGLAPVLGMLSFGTGLSAPFFLLALFPSYLQRLPKSGGWLARVKTVMGFIVLAAAVNYLAKIDSVLHTGLLTRERFLAAWFVLFLLPGLYLLGLLRLEGVKPEEKLGVGRTLAAAAFLVFAVSLLPGMFGARLGELDGFVPPPAGNWAIGGGGSGAAAPVAWRQNGYREALEDARRENKPVLAAFVGYACTNCHWMKSNMFPRPEIQAEMKGFVPVELYTDGVDAASEANQKLEDSRFATVAIPYYAILGPGGEVLATFPGLTRDPAEFLAFLKSGRTGEPARASALAPRQE